MIEIICDEQNCNKHAVVGFFTSQFTLL